MTEDFADVLPDVERLQAENERLRAFVRRARQFYYATEEVSPPVCAPGADHSAEPWAKGSWFEAESRKLLNGAGQTTSNTGRRDLTPDTVFHGGPEPPDPVANANAWMAEQNRLDGGPDSYPGFGKD